MNRNTAPPSNLPAASAASSGPTASSNPQTSQMRFPRVENRIFGVAQHFSSSKAVDPIQYSDLEFSHIQQSLDKTLGPEYISLRPGGGGTTVAYLEGWKALNIANEIFGFNGWSSEIVGYTLDYCDVARDGRILLGLSVVVRVTLKDGTFHEDIGYGFIDNAKNKAAAYEKCKKEALTDGLKRCLRCFGNVLGNCLYDKALMAKLRGIPKQNTTLVPDDLYRDDTFVRMRQQRSNTVLVSVMENSGAKRQKTEAPPVQTPKKESQVKKSPSRDEFDDSFLFSDDVDMPRLDEYEMDVIMNKKNGESKETEPKPAEPKTTEPKASEKQPKAPEKVDAPVNETEVPGKVTPKEVSKEPSKESTLKESEKDLHRPDSNAPDATNGSKDLTSPPSTSSDKENMPLFISAKRFNLLETTPASELPQFDPKFVSPNVRRTVDPTKSVPVKRDISTSQTPSKPPARVGAPPRRALKRLHKDD